MIEQLLFAE